MNVVQRKSRLSKINRRISTTTSIRLYGNPEQDFTPTINSRDFLLISH